MLCPKCNQPVADGARFCGSCGESISAAGNPDSTMIRPPRGPEGGAGATSGGAAPPGGGAGAGGSAGAGGGGYSTGGTAPGGGSPAWAAGLGAAAPGLINRIKNIILTPQAEWPVIEAEPTTIAQLYKGYVIPLAAFSALMSFVRMSVIGISFFRMPLLTGLTLTLVNFVFGLLGLYLVGWIIDMLAPTFSGQRDRRQAMKTAAYASTPGAIGAIFVLLGGLGSLLHLLAAIWGVYLLYLGLPVLMRSPREKAAGYTAAVIVCVILLFVVIGILMAVVNPMRSYNPFGMNGTAMTREERQAQAAGQVGAMLAAAAQKIQEQQAADNARAGTTSSTPAPTASDAPAAAANAQNGAAATASMLAALGGAMAGSRRADPVDFHTLKALLPDSLPGMQRTNAEAGTQGALGMKASSATGDYQGQGTRAQIKIVDASAVSGLLNVAGSMAASNTSESDTGFEKDTTIGGRNVHEKYDNRSKHGELIAIVANRFSVSVTGDGVDVGTLERYAALVDYSKLDAMKDAGVHAQQ